MLGLRRPSTSRRKFLYQTIRILDGIKAGGEAIAGTMVTTTNAEPIQKAMGWYRNLRRGVLVWGYGLYYKVELREI